MPILMGLDEAGYGPTLGPLVLAATTFRFTDDPPDDLWRLLRRSVTRSPRAKDRRIPIADSKAVFTPKKGVGPLEEAVLAAALAARGDARGGLSARLGLRFAGPDAGYPWYEGAAPRIPVAADLLQVRPRAERMAADLEVHGAAYIGARVVAVEAREFNRAVPQEGNKSVLLFSTWSRLLRDCLAAVGDGPVHITADRHGGRKAYLPLLMQYLGDLGPTAVAEGPIRSEYRLDGGRVTLCFQVRAEAESLPVALASMTAKYVREIRMAVFNRYWAGRVEDLRPTSGYPQDARRFLRAIRPTMRGMGIPREALIRCR